MGMSCTYAPEDNKLRFYADARLSPELYERVKAMGFRWAPKQELFVAPAWTPAREDFLIELCGEIGDEDTTLVERAEAKADRLEDLSGRKAVAAERTLAAVDQLAGGIPLGQPILVGHHSEKRARKHAEKIESGTRKAVNLWESSKYWADRAQGALHHAKYKELPGVRVRRIKKIEADLRREQKLRNAASGGLKLWSKDGLTREQALAIANYDHVSILTPGTTNYRSLWSLLEADEMTAQEAAGRAVKAHQATLTRCDRWIAHYEHRLAYERAMLGEQTGVVADLANGKAVPEKGGACKHRVYRDIWLYVQKVNKVTVTVWDNWGNGGKNFSRTLPFDKLAALMTAAEVEAARADGRLVESSDKIGFVLLDEPVRAPRPAPAVDATAAKFEDLGERLRSGRVVETAVAPTLFPTPNDVADQMVDLAEMGFGMSVLEPSAGTGQLVAALHRHGAWRASYDAGDCRLVLVELNVALSQRLRATYPSAECHCEDFLEVVNLEPFDRVLMNPPFDNGKDLRHILRALELLKEDGILVAVCANGPRQSKLLRPLADVWSPLPAATFQGTGVSAVVVRISRSTYAESALRPDRAEVWEVDGS